MAVLDTNVIDIIQTDEYVNDLELLTNLVINSIGVEQFVDNPNPFVYTVCSLAAIHRYFVRHQIDLVDIDKTPYLNLIQDEIGLNLPLSDDIPLIEWIRENKSWYGHRGALPIYNFIADLVGTPLEVDFPSQLIFKPSETRSCLSGASTGYNSPLPFAESKLARIRDGIVWSQFTYIVRVLEAQNLITFTDLINLLQNVHPAGTKMFLVFEYGFEMQGPEPIAMDQYYDDITEDFYMISPVTYVTLDNNWILDGTQCLSMHNGTFLIPALVLEVIPAWEPEYGYRQLPSDLITNTWITNDTYTGVQRGIANGDGTYTQVYADNDSIVYVNCTTNIGLNKYTFAELENYTFRQLQYCAVNLDAQNLHGQEYMPQLLLFNLDISS